MENQSYRSKNIGDLERGNLELFALLVGRETVQQTARGGCCEIVESAHLRGGNAQDRRGITLSKNQLPPRQQTGKQTSRDQAAKQREWGGSR